MLTHVRACSHILTQAHTLTHLILRLQAHIIDSNNCKMTSLVIGSQGASHDDAVNAPIYKDTISPKAKQSISFHPTVPASYLLHVRDYTRAEIQACWCSPKHIAQNKMKLPYIAKLKYLTMMRDVDSRPGLSKVPTSNFVDKWWPAITPAKLRETEIRNEQITEQFGYGTSSLGHKDYHWLAKPLAHVLVYNLEHKAQWVDSIELARTCFAKWHKFVASSTRCQHEFMESWMLSAGDR
jgi:hypothetical protein